MIETISFGYRYGTLVHTFDNGCLVVASMPGGYEVALTMPEQGFPIRTIQGDNGPWQVETYKQAEERAKDIADQIVKKYGTTLPEHLACKD